MKAKSPATLAYVIGVALGDGNLSNHNGRAVRLRITCDNKYPKLIDEISAAVQKIAPENKVSLVPRKNCTDISCYSNTWENLLGWKAKCGPKHLQKARVPSWILKNKKYQIACLRGLLQTDGSVYIDRGYTMINFVTIIPELAEDVSKIMTDLGFKPNVQILKKNRAIRNTKYTIRISKDTEKFIGLIHFKKE